MLEHIYIAQAQIQTLALPSLLAGVCQTSHSQNFEAATYAVIQYKQIWCQALSVQSDWTCPAFHGTAWLQMPDAIPNSATSGVIQVPF